MLEIGVWFTAESNEVIAPREKGKAILICRCPIRFGKADFTRIADDQPEVIHQTWPHAVPKRTGRRGVPPTFRTADQIRSDPERGNGIGEKIPEFYSGVS